MDFDQNDHFGQPPASPPPRPPHLPVGLPITGQSAGPPRRGGGWRILWGILLAFSMLANIGLFLLLIGVIGAFAVSGSRVYDEAVIQQGSRTNKIVVINLEGMIHGEQARNIARQLKIAGRDRNVRGVILRVNSPGGTIAGSDQIYKEIRKFKQKENIPVVAFMQGVAASGGYYASVACDKIMAERTVITGSIGVMMGYFVFDELLEEKLGVFPVFLARGEKKNWPSSFEKPSEEQKQYLQEKLLDPAYERFVEVVAEGREGILTESRIRELADGSIYGAVEARDAKLVDEVGYLDDAIEVVESLAGIRRAHVVEYRRPFSLADVLMMQANAAKKIDQQLLHELCTPQVLYLWSAF